MIAWSSGKASQKENAIKYCIKVEEMLTKMPFKTDYLLWRTWLIFGEIFRFMENFPKAYEYAKKSISAAQKFIGIDPSLLMDSLHSLGLILFIDNDYKNSIEYLMQSISIGYKMKEVNYKKIAKIEDLLGYVYFKNYEYRKAIEYYLKSEAIYIKLYGETSVFIGLNNEIVGEIYSFISNYAFSIEYLVRALRICAHLYGEHCICYADICNLLGQVNGKMDNINEALEYFKKAEDILKNEVPSNYVFNLYSNIFTFYLETKQYDHAYEYIQKYLKISEVDKINEPYHYLQSLAMSCQFYNYNNQPELCIESFKKIQEIIEQLPDKNKEVCATCYFSYGEALLNKGDYKNAIKYCHKAIDICIIIYTDKSHSFLHMYEFLGKAYISNKDYKNAEICYMKIITTLSNLAIENEYLGFQFVNLGIVCMNQGKYKNAIKHSKKAIEILSEFNPDKNSEDFARAYHTIATSFQCENNTQLSMQYYNQAINSFLLFYGNEDNELIASSYCNIALLYKNLKNTKVASIYYNKVQNIISKLPKSSTIAFLYCELAKEFAELKFYRNAIEYLEKSLSIYEELHETSYKIMDWLYRRIIFYYGVLGDARMSLNWFQKAEPFYLKNFVDESDNCLNFFGCWCKSARDHRQNKLAGDILHKTIKLIKRINKNADTGELYSSLGMFKNECGQIKESLLSFHMSIKIYQKSESRKFSVILYEFKHRL